MFVIVAVVLAVMITITIMIVNVYGMTVVTVPVKRGFQGITVFVVMGVPGMFGVEGLIPLLVGVIL